jgi:hypothetical protein
VDAPFKQRIEHAIRLREEEFGEQERELLRNWMKEQSSKSKGPVTHHSAQMSTTAKVSVISARATISQKETVVDPRRANLSDILTDLLDEPTNPTILFAPKDLPTTRENEIRVE